MAKKKPSSQQAQDRTGFPGEGQSGPTGNNASHGRSGHSDPGMTPGISQAAKKAQREEESEGLEDEEASLEQQRKEASSERD